MGQSAQLEVLYYFDEKGLHKCSCYVMLCEEQNITSQCADPVRDGDGICNACERT